MADFSAAFTAGTTTAVWADPAAASGLLPSRINPDPLHPHRYRLAAPGVEVEITATVGGVEGPLDAALGGRTFLGWFAECPGPRPNVTSPGGQSSVRRFTPVDEGHYTYVFRRLGGGGLIFHLDVQAR